MKKDLVGKILFQKIILVVGFLIFFSCSSPPRGCSDKDAENYEPAAKVDCDCCIFYGKAVLSYPYTYSDKLESQGVNSFIYYVDNVYSGRSTKSIDSYTSNNPIPVKTFSDLNGIKDGNGNVITLNLGSRKTRQVLVKITDQNGGLIWAGNITMIANRFVPIHLQ